MTHIKRILAGALIATPLMLAAQENSTGYFMENYTLGHEQNPAFAPESGYVGFPALSGLGIATQGTLHLSSIFYNLDGQTVLFTNPGISAAEVMDGIHDKNRLGAEMKINIINVGFKGLGGYNTIGINARASVQTQLPGSIFSLLKEGVSNQTYDISNLRARAFGYGEIALGHSHDIRALPGLRVGGKVKFLLGYGQADARLNEASLILGTDSWDIRTDAEILASVRGLKYKTKYDSHTGIDYVNGTEISSTGLNGFGLGFDLGAEYKWRDFTFSASLLDLGFIHWNNTSVASTQGVRQFQTSRYEFDVTGSDDEDEWDRMSDDLATLYQLSDLGEQGGRTTSLAATLNVGVRYQLPCYKRLHFGLLSHSRLQGAYSWSQVMLEAGVRPVDCLEAALSMQAGTYGLGFGWLLNLNLHKGFSMHMGMDRIPGRLAKQGAPLNSNLAFNFGINFPF